ncbi:uncharacterized protein LOC108103720 [Drosophila eugracilis]|uniref:uncharacterized protein LOC108103720 n=1 Tax=Drosophila eugracilis TaxID=29029 RepID=UPI0007E6341B|nr:uncharacterized protein LOC108103720 [Drosophila eugracilis]
MPGTICKEAKNARDVLGLSKTSKHSGRTEAEIIEDKLKDIKSHKEQYNEMPASLDDYLTPVNLKTMNKKSKSNEGKPKIGNDDDKPSTSSTAIIINSMASLIAMETDGAETQQVPEVCKIVPDEEALVVNEDTVDEGLVLNEDAVAIEINNASGLVAKKTEDSL